MCMSAPSPSPFPSATTTNQSAGGSSLPQGNVLPDCLRSSCCLHQGLQLSRNSFLCCSKWIVMNAAPSLSAILHSKLQRQSTIASPFEVSSVHFITHVLLVQDMQVGGSSPCEGTSKDCFPMHITENPPPDDVSFGGSVHGIKARVKGYRMAAGPCLWRSVH